MEPDRPAGEAPRTLTRIVLRGAGIAGTGFVLTQAISLATYLALARLLGTGDFGTFAAATVVVTVGLVVGESGLMAALVQRRERIEEAFDSAFVASLAGGLLLSAAGVAAAPILTLFFHSHRVGDVALAMAGSMLLRLALIVPSAWLQRNFSFLRRGVLDPLGALAFAAGAISAAAAGLGVWALVIGTYSQLTLEVAAAWGLVRWRPRVRLASVSVWRELARFGRPVFGANLISRANSQVPVLAVGHVLGARVLGQLAYAVRVASQPMAAIVDVGAYVLFPAFARIAPDDARFRAGLLRALRWTCAIAFPLGLMLVPLGTPAVVLVFGAKWRLAGHAVMVLGIYCAALALDSIASETWKAAGRPELLPRMHAVSFGLTVICVAALAQYGLVAVVLGMAIGELGAAAYGVYGIGSAIDVPRRTLVAELWPPALAAAAMAGIVFVAEHLMVHSDRHSPPVGIALLALDAMLGVAVYVPCLAALSRSCRRELTSSLRRRVAAGRGRAPRLTALARQQRLPGRGGEVARRS